MYPRVFVEIDDLNLSVTDLLFGLDSETSHHLRNVLRLELGDKVTAVSKQSGIAYNAILEELSPQLKLRIIDSCKIENHPSKTRSIVFALAKGEHNELMCEKVTELGVENIILWQAERSIPKGLSPTKMQRLEKIAQAAAKQSGKLKIPRVLYFPSLDLVLNWLKDNTSKQDKFICCSLSATAKPLHAVKPPDGQVHIVVGPEGDLTPSEERILSSYAFELVSLGHHVLRCETAAIVAVAMVQALWEH